MFCEREDRLTGSPLIVKIFPRLTVSRLHVDGSTLTRQSTSKGPPLSGPSDRSAAGIQSRDESLWRFTLTEVGGSKFIASAESSGE